MGAASSQSRPPVIAMNELSEIEVAPADARVDSEPVYPPGLEYPPLRLTKDSRHAASQFGLSMLFRAVTLSAIVSAACRIDAGIVVVALMLVAACLLILAGVLVPWTAFFALTILIACGLCPLAAIVLVPLGAVIIGAAAIVRWQHPASCRHRTLATWIEEMSV